MTNHTKTSTTSNGTNSEGLGNNIVKQGFLWIKRPPRSYWNKLKAWHKRYFLLRDSFIDNTSILQMYNCQQDVKSGQVPVLSLELNETVHIGIASESHRFANVLVLVCNGRAPLLLAADDELAARSWHLALDLTAQSRNCDIPNSMTSLSHSCCQDSIGSVKSADHHRHHHNSGSDSSTNGSACSCAPAFVRESSGFSDPTHGLRSNVSSVEPIPSDEFLWNWHENNSFDSGLVMERFQVCVQPTDASERACLRGQLQLVIFTRGVGVARIGDFECFLLWPIAFIRQYRHESLKNKNNNGLNGSATNRNGKVINNKRQTLVTLEVGRRCSTGEGIFAFRTTHGQEIMRQLKRAIANWAQYKASCRSMATTNKQFFSWSHAHRPRNSRSRSSTPCTPNMCKALDLASSSSQSVSQLSPRKLLLAINGHKRDIDGEKTVMNTDDVNYVLPVFTTIGDNEEIGSTSDAECNYYRKSYNSIRHSCDSKLAAQQPSVLHRDNNNSSGDNNDVGAHDRYRIKCLLQRSGTNSGIADSSGSNSNSHENGDDGGNAYMEVIAT